MKNNSQFKTLRHIETVRNYLNLIIRELMVRQEQHDQSKLQEPELHIFNEFTPKLRRLTYGSTEYKENLKQMKPAVDHHNSVNRHHPEYFKYHECNGCFKRFNEQPDHCDICFYSQFTIRSNISQMNLVDLIEMLCDWKAAGMRHDDGNIFAIIEINQKRFEYSDQLKQILINTAKELNDVNVFHHAEES